MKSKVVKTTPPKGGNVVKNVFFSVIMLIIVGFGYYIITAYPSSLPSSSVENEVPVNEESYFADLVNNDKNLSDYINKSNNTTYIMAFNSTTSFNDCAVNDLLILENYLEYKTVINNFVVYAGNNKTRVQNLKKELWSKNVKVSCDSSFDELKPSKEVMHINGIKDGDKYRDNYIISAYNMNIAVKFTDFDDLSINKNGYKIKDDMHRFINNNELNYTRSFVDEDNKTIENYGYYNEFLFINEDDLNSSNFTCTFENKSLDKFFKLNKKYINTQLFMTNEDPNLIKQDENKISFDDNSYKYAKIKCFDENKTEYRIRFGHQKIITYIDSTDENYKYYVNEVTYSLRNVNDNPNAVRNYADFSFKRWRYLGVNY